jgi:anaerobic selenocysteine-containing dehydrogenase
MAVLSVAPPVMRPLHQTRAMPDVLLDVARRLAEPLTPPFAWQTFDEMLAATFNALPKSTPEADVWAEAQLKGGWWGQIKAQGPRPTAQGPRPNAQLPDSTEGQAPVRPEPRFAGDVQQYPFHFLPYPSSVFFDGSVAHLPWLQEMPDPMTSAMWSSWVEINPATAAGLGIATGDIVDVTSDQGSVRAAAIVTPGIAPNVIAMPVGQGHQTFTRYASGRGANPVALLAPLTEPATGALAWAATRVRIARVSGPDGRLVLFAGGDRENPYEEIGRG